MTSIFCWGSNHCGQLGIGNLELSSVFSPECVKDPPAGELHYIVCGETHSLFILNDGRLYSCGNNDYGQLGHDKRRSKPEQIELLKHQTVVQACVGVSHSVCLTSAGEIFSWGDNTYGQLGRGRLEPEQCRQPKLIKFPHTVVQVSCGRYHCLLLTDDGKLFSWGDNKFGQLGLGHTSKHDQPQLITSLKGIPVAQVVCGGSHSFILSKSGAIFGWGRNCFGQLGLNDEKDRNFPCLCKSLRNQRATYIACGEDHTAALTLDGGLFTYGAGTYGQLGHGSKAHEIVPKRILELMGSTVTQIACGRRHTLVYVADIGKLYSFGSGANGQLGLKSSEIKAIPTYIDGPFVSYKEVACDPATFVVRGVSAGGDLCFVWTSSSQVKKAPLDFRNAESVLQIRTLSIDLLDRISQLSVNDNISVELEEAVTKVFSSASCLNSSFLLSKNEHYGSSSKKHGVDMQCVRQQLEKISTTSNVVIVQKILSSIGSSLYPSLPSSPPDVEALRVYLMLPHLPMFEQPKYYSSLIEPFGLSILNLDKHASRVLELWWGSIASTFFLRVIYVFKETVIYVLQLPEPQNLKEMETRYQAMYVSLEILKKLSSVNEQNGQIVPYNKFYVNDMKDRVNLKGDYVQWVQQQSKPKFGPAGQNQLLFCNYPFTFDAAAKSLLLQTDALMQMQTAIDEVNRRNFQSLFLPIDPVNPCLVFYVHRNNIVHDTLQQLMNQQSADLKKPLKVVFHGEEAQDEGGVRKEFFMLLLRELLDPKYGMFKYEEDSRMHWFSPFAFEDHQMYCLIGCLCGLAIYNSVIIQLSFPLALFKKLLNGTPTLDDLKELMPTLGRSFDQLLKHEGDDIEDVFCLTFEISQDCFGEIKNMELTPGGSSKTVNKQNRSEFVELYVDYVFNKSVESHFHSFHTGFHKVCGGRVLELFHPDELRSMVVGNENYDFLEFEKNTVYKGEYHRYHQTIKHFWDVFHDLCLEDKKKFLLFLTGSDKIPVIGMKHVKLVIQPMNVEEKYLPVAHTCFNLLDLPRYSTKDRMKDKLLQAIQQTEGFGLV